MKAERHDEDYGTVDPAEVAQLSADAEEWWDPSGRFHALHRLNPARLQYIRDQLCSQFDRDPTVLRPLTGLEILDVGCGGGLLSEPLCRMGASVTAIDASAPNIAGARIHAEAGGLDITFRHAAVEDLCREDKRFDAIVSMEVVEHVSDVDAFLDGCCLLARNGGAVMLSTLNRTVRSALLGIVAAEYLLGWLPRGSHRWTQFVRPSELARALRRNGLVVHDVSGLSFDPVRGEWRVSDNLSVNYLMFATKP